MVRDLGSGRANEIAIQVGGDHRLEAFRKRGSIELLPIGSLFQIFDNLRGEAVFDMMLQVFFRVEGMPSGASRLPGIATALVGNDVAGPVTFLREFPICQFRQAAPGALVGEEPGMRTIRDNHPCRDLFHSESSVAYDGSYLRRVGIARLDLS